MFADLLGLSASCSIDQRCAQLRKQIFTKSAKLLFEIGKYDPVADGRGGFPTFGGRRTTPGGHYGKILRLQRGLKKDIAEYKWRCSNNGKWPPVPRSIDETASRVVPEPVIDPESNIDRPNAESSAIALGGALLFLLRLAPLAL